MASLDRGSDFQGGLDSNYYSHNLLPITGYITACDNNCVAYYICFCAGWSSLR